MDEKRQVVAYFIHDHEEAAGKALLPGAQATPSFLVGDASPDTIRQLQAAGLVVKIPGLPEQPSAPGPENVANTNADDIPAPVDDYIVHVSRPLLAEDSTALTSAGGQIIQRIALGAYRVRLMNTDVARVRALPFVDGLTWVGKTAPAIPSDGTPLTAPGQPPAASADLLYDIKLRSDDDLAAATAWMATNEVVVVGTARSKLRIRIGAASPLLDTIARLPYVDRIYPYRLPVLYNSHARALTGVDNPAINAAFDGAGETIAIADTGIDTTHPAFAGGRVSVLNLGRAALGDDPQGHGTHVAGIAAGNGAGSGALDLRGVAPAAKIIFQSLLDAEGGLGGLPIDLNDLFQVPYQMGARIHNDSWGSPSEAQYGVNSEEVDAFVFAHPDMFVVIAAGNDGTSSGLARAAPGFVDWLSIGSPATSKNGLTVGASQSDRTDGPFGALTWNQFDAARFPQAPTATEKMTGNPDSLAAFSSRGPTLDRRIKPDLVAPGTDVASSTSSKALPSYDRIVTEHGAALPYGFLSGTSMAAPHVAGCAALVRQFYRTRKNYATPSAALIKATLIGGSRRLTGADACAPAAGEPNYHQGHGRVDMSRSLEHHAFTIFYSDDWTPGSGLANTGDRARWQVTLPANGTLRVCMAYTDLPARGLQNDLNLVVQRAGDVQKFIGNADLPDSLSQPDSQNNVELVRLDAATAGVYYIQVMVSNLLRGPQTFALFVGGDGLTGFGPY